MKIFDYLSRAAVTAAIMGSGLVFVAAPVMVSASAASDAILEGVEGAAGEDDPEINDAVSTAISIFSVVVGIVAVIMLMVGSFKFITSSGDAGKVANAKSTILYALIGLTLVVLSQLIVQFVLASSDGSAAGAGAGAGGPPPAPPSRAF